MNKKTFQKGQTFPGNQYHNQTNIIYPLFWLKSIFFSSFAEKRFGRKRRNKSGNGKAHLFRTDRDLWNSSCIRRILFPLFWETRLEKSAVKDNIID